MDQQISAPVLPHGRATELVTSWLQQTQGMPVTLQLTRLGLMVTSSIEEAIREARATCTRVTRQRNAARRDRAILRRALITLRDACDGNGDESQFMGAVNYADQVIEKTEGK